MRILFVNDDGYDSPGLHAVADLFKKDNEIAVVAPSVQRSCFSHALTVGSRMAVKRIDGYDYPVYAVAGTPVDCVKIGVKKLFGVPDLVVSGINTEENLGSDVMYSGTVSAAADAAHLGVPAFALSLDDPHPTLARFVKCATFFKKNLGKILSIGLPRASFWNINFPACEPKGVRFAKMGTDYTYIDAYSGSDEEVYLDGKREYDGIDPEGDEALCKAGYITVVPLKTDMTDYDLLRAAVETELEL